ncbi:MAG TPA: FAD-binding oxidoreductase, partial [Candidatus Dormibacteraeota bacterium]|nr:FAD-binding oxidoreductase [Candidatus Dormibacteraeota bacterium]
MKPHQKSLQDRIRGAVSSGDQVSGERTTNFGHVFSATPRFLVEPKSGDDVAAAILFAREQGLTLSVRGSGH